MASCTGRKHKLVAITFSRLEAPTEFDAIESNIKEG
jgi:hypothetical protein